MKDWLEIAGAALLMLLVLALGLAMVVAFYGVIFGGIGAMAYLAFKWLVALFI